MNRPTIARCAATCLLARSAVFADSAKAQPAPALPRLELSVGITGMSRGPAEGSERALTAMGFHEDFGNERMTQTRFDGFWKIEIGVGERRTIGILTTRVGNYTRGVREVPGQGSGSIGTHHSIVTRAITLSYRPNGWISFGAGPALHLRRFAIDAPYGPNVGVQSKRALGAVAGVNVKWKRNNGTFAHGFWQYRYAGALSSNNVAVPLGLRNGAVDEAEWPATQIRFSHRMLGVGFGIEF